MTTQERVYLDAQAACGLKNGDLVRVTRKAVDHEGGWKNNWDFYKQQAIGSRGRIIDTDSNGIRVHIKDEDKEGILYFPYFVLEKVEKPAHEFKPFDRVLVRDVASSDWKPNIFLWLKSSGMYQCAYGDWIQCIPYKGNEHLAGTTEAVERWINLK